MSEGTWYRTGLVSLANGSDLVAGVGTEFIANVLPGAIFFAPEGLYEVERAVSDTQLKLVEPYAGPTVAGAEFAIAPTQGAVVQATKQLQAFLSELGELKQAWESGDLDPKGLATKGVKNTVEDLPAIGNTPGDAWLVDGVLYMWTGSVWSNQGSTVTTPELEAVRDQTIAAKNAVQDIAADFGDVAGAVGAATAQANTATTAAGTAASRAADAQGFKIETALLRDQAAASTNARESTAIALADGAIPVGASFTAPLADGALQTYRKTSTTVATPIGAPFAKDAEVKKPVWTGKKNGWTDPFFRTFDLSSKLFLGRNRWWASAQPSAFTNWSRVDQAAFNGNALRRAQGGVNSGPSIWLDEVGAAVGTPVTAYVLVAKAAGSPVVQFPGIFDNGTDTGYVGSAISGVTDTGATTLAAGATAQWMRVSAVVPAGAQRLSLYPYTATASASFDILALWAFRGTPADGPAWPVFGREEFIEARIGAMQPAIDANTGALASNNGKLAYTLLTTQSVTDSGRTTTLDVTGVTPNTQWGGTFRGWLERYTPVGVSFNAIQIGSLGRGAYTSAQRWSTINVVVRTGANSHLGASTVLAAGSIAVDPDQDVLTNLDIILRDPVTGAVKTLSDADFSDGEYAIGVYAANAAGGSAAMSDPRATQANSLGQSYYTSAADPKTATFTSTGAGANNQRIGFRHLLLVSPAEVANYKPTSQFKTDLGLAPLAPQLAVPPKVYALQGREVSVYFDNLTPQDARDWNWDVIGTTQGIQQNERWVLNPSGAVAAANVTLSMFDKLKETAVASAVTSLVVAASTAGAGLMKTALFVGDSLVAAGVITQTLLDIAGTDVMGLTLLGTRGSGANKHEGRGGWTMLNYTNAGPTNYVFTVSGVTVPPAINAAIYSNNGSNFTVQETNLSGGAGTITCSVSGGAPSASGTLTKTNSAAGDAAIAFSSFATAAGNPFWIGGALNFGQYLTNNGFAAPDWVFLALGTNDVLSVATDAAVDALAGSTLTALDGLIASIKAGGASTKVVLVPPPVPTGEQDGADAAWGAGQTRWRFKRNVIRWAAKVYAKYAAQEAARIYIAPCWLNLDAMNNFPRSVAAPVNSRSAVTATRQNNNVHPATSGYQQCADAAWAFLKNNA